EAMAVQPENAFYDAYLSIFFDGAPPQQDTWDPKPGTRSSYPNFQTIDLGVNDKYGQPVRIGGQFSNGNAVFPELADLVMNDPDVKLGIIRSLWHGTADHRLGQMYMNGFWRSQTLVDQYPSM